MIAEPSVVGRCHLCQETKWVDYCGICDHYFCENCRSKWFDRTVEFVKQLCAGKVPGCCGPREEHNHAA